MPVWESEIEVGEDLARTPFAEQFPDLAVMSLRRLGGRLGQRGVGDRPGHRVSDSPESDRNRGRAARDGDPARALRPAARPDSRRLLLGRRERRGQQLGEALSTARVELVLV
jgi:hypothetical protein